MKFHKALPWLFAMALAVGPAVAIHAQQSQQKEPPNPWWPVEPQGPWSQTWHDGFRAGADAANADVKAKRAPDPDRHAQFKQPDLGPMASEDFRDGFRYAYSLVSAHAAQPE
jgi:hypothetical protein